MSEMLEQAIIDAEALKEAALKTAESAIVEKYSNEIKKTMNILLEQPEENVEDLEESEDLKEETPDIPRADLNDSELSEVSEDDVVDINLSKLAEELLEDIGEDEELETYVGEELEEKRRHKDRLEGHPTGPNRERLEEEDEETAVDLEEELLNNILEKLTVDVKNVPTGVPGGASNETLDKDNADIALAQEDVEELEEDEEKTDLEESISKLEEKNDVLLEQTQKYKNMVLQLKEKLEEVNLSNAKLLYTNRVLGNTSLNERQKTKIVEALSNADSIEEAKVIYETLQSAVGNAKKRTPKSLSEVVRRSSTTLPRKKEENKGAPLNDRWRTLAGIK